VSRSIWLRPKGATDERDPVAIEGGRPKPSNGGIAAGRRRQVADMTEYQAENRRRPTLNDPLVTIETSCGEHFELHISELSDRQLTILLDRNSERSDVDPAHIAAMRDELQRRSGTS
jgi:hypothetical protein